MDEQKIYWTIGSILVVAVIGVALLVQSPVRGLLSVTVTGSDGVAHAATVNLSLKSTQFVSVRNSEALVLAAIPSPNNEKVAYVTRQQDGTSSIHIESGPVTTRPSVQQGTSDTPSWSADGTSIAYAEHGGTTTASALDPDAWTVVRAVAHGDALIIGHGFRPFPSVNQRTFALTKKGIALLTYNDSDPSIVVASPVPVHTTTPFAVSHDGVRVAWAAPGDNSLQVFENVNGYFVPLLLKKDITFQSLAFSPDGQYLVVAQPHGATTTIAAVRVDGGMVSNVIDVPGFVALHTWIYEK